MVRYRDHLYPYWGNLYGYTYGLNEDFDMMLTSPAHPGRTGTAVARAGLVYDLGAVLVIALFYNAGISWVALGGAGGMG